jgi:predicted GNAT superfamily acetyltransferase
MSEVPRDVVPADFPALVRLNNAAVPAVNALSQDDFARFAGAADLYRVIGPEAAPDALLIAYQPGRPYDSANYRWFEARFSSFLYVDRVVVAETRRGDGLGAALYADFEARARSAGIPRLVCEVKLIPPNPGSMRFHERFGFTRLDSATVGEKTVQYLVKELGE